jgi:LacI family transcriptional regulator
VSTMRDVAAAAGVSAKTVSRVMRNDRYVSDDVRQRVEHAIVELQYVPNVLARSFRSGSDTAIGVAVPDVSDPFFAAIIRAVEQIARARGVAVFVTSLSDDEAQERTGLEVLLGRQIAGLISTPISRDQSYLKPWQPRMAMVFIDRPPGKISADSVIEDDLAGADMATTHLLAHGHRRVGFLGDTLATATTTRRLEGYRAALDRGGVPYDPHLVAVGTTDRIDTRTATGQLLDAEDPPTAIFSSNARCSLEVVPTLQSLRRADLALISFGDFPLASALHPPLTVVDQDPEAIGRLAATRLFERLDHPKRRLSRRMVIPVSLVRRASCCVKAGEPAPSWWAELCTIE